MDPKKKVRTDGSDGRLSFALNGTGACGARIESASEVSLCTVVSHTLQTDLLLVGSIGIPINNTL